MVDWGSVVRSMRQISYWAYNYRGFLPGGTAAIIIRVDGTLVVDLERLWYVLQNLLQSLDQDHRELKKALLALLTVDTTTFCRRLKVAQAPGELTDLATRLALFPFYGEQSWWSRVEKTSSTLHTCTEWMFAVSRKAVFRRGQVWLMSPPSSTWLSWMAESLPRQHSVPRNLLQPDLPPVDGAGWPAYSNGAG